MELQVMANNNDSMTIRAGSKEKKEDFKIRCKNLKAKHITQAEIFEAGLLALEGGNTEQQIIYKKNKTIAERDEAILKVKDSNMRIEAYNRQLKDRYKSRYGELSLDDNIINLYDGNLL